MSQWTNPIDAADRAQDLNALVNARSFHAAQSVHRAMFALGRGDQEVTDALLARADCPSGYEPDTQAK